MWKVLTQEKDFYTIIDNQATVLVNFFTDRCFACRQLEPKLEKIVIANPELTAVKVNAWDFPNLVREFNITAVPTLFLFRNGELVKEMLGDREEDELKEFLDY